MVYNEIMLRHLTSLLGNDKCNGFVAKANLLGLRVPDFYEIYKYVGGICGVIVEDGYEYRNEIQDKYIYENFMQKFDSAIANRHNLNACSFIFADEVYKIDSKNKIITYGEDDTLLAMHLGKWYVLNDNTIRKGYISYIPEEYMKTEIDYLIKYRLIKGRLIDEKTYTDLLGFVNITGDRAKELYINYKLNHK